MGGGRSSDVTFVTLSDSRYFPGTVALFNSLRLTGNVGRFVVVDRGLTEPERRVLEDNAVLATLPKESSGAHPLLVKPLAASLVQAEIVIAIDSDMIVAGSLDQAISTARAGRIFVYPDHHGAWDRRFPEWEKLFGLGAPVRSGQTYVNSGFVALSPAAWPEFFSRLVALCARVPRDMIAAEHWDAPFAAGDQDVLNAFLMSEVPADAVEIGPASDEAYWDVLRRVKVEDQERLICLDGHDRVRILHYSFVPKAWERSAWRRFRRNDAYVRLLKRVLLWDDVQIQLDPRSLPYWLRKGIVAGAAAVLLSLFMDLDASLGLLALTRPMRHSLRRLLPGSRGTQHSRADTTS